MSEKEWYGSDEHFKTEESYQEYKKRKLKSSLKFNIPNTKDILKGTIN